MHRIMLAIATALTASGGAVAADPVPYPDGYRDWKHVSSMVLQKGHPLFDLVGGIHHLYANPDALDGYRAGKFPDGAVIVFDLLEAVATGDNAIVEGPRKIVAVMHKDTTKFAATGGWGFEGFAGGDSAQRAVGDKAAEACFGCHEAQKANDYVFSKLRD